MSKACIHYWVIEAVRTETAAGVCKKCGATGTFDNQWRGGDKKEYGKGISKRRPGSGKAKSLQNDPLEADTSGFHTLQHRLRQADSHPRRRDSERVGR